MGRAADNGEPQAGNVVGSVVPDAEDKQRGIGRISNGNSIDFTRLIRQKWMLAIRRIDEPWIIERKRVGGWSRPRHEVNLGFDEQCCTACCCPTSSNDRNKKT